jgi:hypothetical protein
MGLSVSQPGSEIHPRSLSRSALSLPDNGLSTASSPAQDEAAPPKSASTHAQPAQNLSRAVRAHGTETVPSITDLANRITEADLLSHPIAKTVPQETLQAPSPGSSKTDVDGGSPAENAVQAESSFQPTTSKSFGVSAPKTAAPNQTASPSPLVVRAEGTQQVFNQRPDPIEPPRVAQSDDVRPQHQEIQYEMDAPALRAPASVPQTGLPPLTPNSSPIPKTFNQLHIAGPPVAGTLGGLNHNPTFANPNDPSAVRRSSFEPQISASIPAHLPSMSLSPEPNPGRIAGPRAERIHSQLQPEDQPLEHRTAPVLPVAGNQSVATGEIAVKLSPPSPRRSEEPPMASTAGPAAPLVSWNPRAPEASRTVEHDPHSLQPQSATPSSENPSTTLTPESFDSMSAPNALAPEANHVVDSGPHILQTQAALSGSKEPPTSNASRLPEPHPARNARGQEASRTVEPGPHVLQPQAAVSGSKEPPSPNSSGLSETLPNRNAQVNESSHVVDPGVHVPQPQAASLDGDATSLMRAPAIQSAALKGTGSTDRGETVSVPSSAREPFAAIDAATRPDPPNWVHLGSRRAEAEFQDPSLGWIGVRADGSAGQVHATLMPRSSDAAQELGGHMAGLNDYLADVHTPVQSLHIALPEAREAGSSSEREQAQQMGQGSNQGMSQNAHQDGSSAAPRNSQPAIPVASDAIHLEAQASLGNLSPPAASEFSGLHISVMA